MKSYFICFEILNISKQKHGLSVSHAWDSFENFCIKISYLGKDRADSLDLLIFLLWALHLLLLSH